MDGLDGGTSLSCLSHPIKKVITMALKSIRYQGQPKEIDVDESELNLEDYIIQDEITKKVVYEQIIPNDSVSYSFTILPAQIDTINVIEFISEEEIYFDIWRYFGTQQYLGFFQDCKRVIINNEIDVTTAQEIKFTIINSGSADSNIILKVYGN